MMDLKISNLLRRMEGRAHLHHYHPDKFIKTN
jgi:hypothetical protein